MEKENKDESKEVQRRSSRATRWTTATTIIEIELEVLDCPICYQPLKPPVFQCAVGHMACSLCYAKLTARNCHTCGTANGFRRCFAVEHIVESVQVPCANAGRGCPAKTAYHGKEEHEKTCPHAEAEYDGKDKKEHEKTCPRAETGISPDVAQGTEQGGNRGNKGRNLVTGLVLAIASIPVTIPFVCRVIKHLAHQNLARALQL